MRLTGSQGVRVYRPSDYPLISKWYEARGRKAPNRAILSDLGFIIDDRVAGFLYTTNSNIAMIEGVIADPNTLPSMRRQSLLKLCCLLTDTAVAMGYQNVIALTAHPSIEEICTKLGFKQNELKMWSFSDTELTSDSVDQ